MGIHRKTGNPPDPTGSGREEGDRTRSDYRPSEIVHAARVTPWGRGAVATIAVEGPGALSAVGAFFRPATGIPLESVGIARTVYGIWQNEERVEDIVVGRFGAEHFELHCHGGTAASTAILDDLRRVGVQQISWPQWVTGHTGSSLRADAWRALADAPTEKTALHLLAQFNGALDRQLARIADTLGTLGSQSQAIELLDALTATSQYGLHLTTPWIVVLAGSPNVGKSSLINALVGYDRSLVYDQPGTTRDAVTAITSIEGWPVELVDTAGIRQTDEPLEAAGIDRTRNRLAHADLILLVSDASATNDDDDNCRSQEAWPEAVVVRNKIDLVDPDMVDAGPDTVPTSAITGFGIDHLVQRIASHLVPTNLSSDEPLLFQPHHVAWIEQVRSLVDQGQYQQARRLILASQAQSLC